jgi:endonuclease-8
MQKSVDEGFPKGLLIYKRAGRPCPRCGATIRARGQGDANRTTYWCPGCQR